LVDLYAGEGLLGGGLAARRGAVLTAVERHPASAADARVNLAGLDARVIQVEVQQWRPPSEGPVDVLLADPARAGLGRRDAAALLRAAPATIILVSCDPASLARDALLLAAGGYALGEVRVLDLFPHTVHVEAVTRFDRDGSAGQHVLEGGQQLGRLRVGEGAEAGDDVA
jgi:tRNA/tmRNA/rRNA uracil-C5-methylase (TrmA/RlmC/RlmD family)